MAEDYTSVSLCESGAGHEGLRRKGQHRLNILKRSQKGWSETAYTEVTGCVGSSAEQSTSSYSVS